MKVPELDFLTVCKAEGIFIKSYEPDGIKSTDFTIWGSTQKTLSQFH